MKLSVFKADLERIGVKYERLKKLNHEIDLVVDAFPYSDLVLKQIIRDQSRTAEGHNYWDEKRKLLMAPRILAKEDEIVAGYEIINQGDFWKVGCKQFNKAKRLKMLKLIALHDGYEIKKAKK